MEQSINNVNVNVNVSAYKAAYNKHRRRPSDPSYIGDINELVDFCNVKVSGDSRILHLNNNMHPKKPWKELDFNGYRYRYGGPSFGLASHPDFVYVPQALSLNMQNELAYQSLTEFVKTPHATNIDLVPINVKKGEIENGDLSMWDIWKNGLCDKQKQNNDRRSTGISLEKRRRQELKDTKNNSTYYKSFDKLSWATTGYHYDWTARSYTEARKSPMPKSLLQLGSAFSRLDPSLIIGDEKNFPTNSEEDEFHASASIINYYTLKSNMGGHRDDLELALTKPVISISLGLPAVFLLGGLTKDDPVVPILVRPGDVMLLAGKSRLCYHGMARVIPVDVMLPAADSNIHIIQSWKSISNNEIGFEEGLSIPKDELGPLENFLSSHRININVRQVLPNGMTKIPTS